MPTLRGAVFAGLDTGPEVNQLLGGLVVTPGTTITHEAVEEILGLERRSTRYHTITTRWRRALRRTQNIDMQGIPGVGFRVLSEPERLDISVRDFTRSARGMHRAHERLMGVRVFELSDDKRVQYDHTQRAFNLALAEVTRATQTLAAPAPTATLPRPQNGTH